MAGSRRTSGSRGSGAAKGGGARSGQSSTSQRRRSAPRKRVPRPAALGSRAAPANSSNSNGVRWLSLMLACVCAVALIEAEQCRAAAARYREENGGLLVALTSLPPNTAGAMCVAAIVLLVDVILFRGNNMGVGPVQRSVELLLSFSTKEGTRDHDDMINKYNALHDVEDAEERNNSYAKLVRVLLLCA